MSPKPRKQDNKGLPRRWRFRAGKYRYRVPPGLEHLWDGKSEFTLGSTLPEAHRAWADRVETASAVNTMSDLLDRYEREVVSAMRASTRRDKPRILTKLRGVFGEMRPQDIQPSHVYTYYDKRSAKTAAKREIEVLRHALSKAVRWGLMAKNPLLGTLRLESQGRRTKYVTDDQVLAVLKLEPKKGTRVVQAYIGLKLLTGLRRTDLLRLRESDIREDGIHVATSKTGENMIIERTEALNEAIKACKEARPMDISPWLFCTRSGAPYIQEDATANGWESLWRRTMLKLAEQERFPERALRNKCATDAETLEHAQALLAHSDSRTTRRFYRLKATKVKPLR